MEPLVRTVFVELARHARWQNGVLFELCADLGDAARRRDEGLFFGSIHATLNHILYTDGVLLDYALAKRPPEAFEPATIVHDDFDALRGARTAFDADLEARLAAAGGDWFAEEVRFVSERLGRERAFPRAFVLSQLFNHQTHHRSQVTSALHRLGVDYGETDLPANPLSQF